MKKIELLRKTHFVEDAYGYTDKELVDKVNELIEQVNKLSTKKRGGGGMNFELGKEYIVKVSKEGIIPIEEFKSDRFYDKDHDDLDFLTDEEKIVVINNVLDKIRAEIIHEFNNHKKGMTVYDIVQIIKKYKIGSESEEV